MPERRAGLAATTALASTGPGPSSPAAAKTWSVAPMNITTGGSTIGSIVLTDASTGARIKCGGSFTFSINGGMGLTGTLATVSVQFSQCILPGARQFGTGDSVTVSATTNSGMTITSPRPAALGRVPRNA